MSAQPHDAKSYSVVGTRPDGTRHIISSHTTHQGAETVVNLIRRASDYTTLQIVCLMNERARAEDNHGNRIATAKRTGSKNA